MSVSIQPAALVPILRGLNLKSLEELQQALASDPDSKSADGTVGDVLRKELQCDNDALLNGHWTGIAQAFQLLAADASSSETQSVPLSVAQSENKSSDATGDKLADKPGDKPGELPKVGGPGETKGVDDSGNSGDPVKAQVSLKKDVETEILSGYTDVQIPDFQKDKVDIVKKDGKIYATLKTDLEEPLVFSGITGKDSEGHEKKIDLEVSQGSGGWVTTAVKGGAIVLGLIGALVAGTSSEGGKGWLGVLGGVLATLGALAFKPVRDALFFFESPENK